GYCNGVALASMRYAEPFREVDVVNPDGHRIRFHPNDIKGLLSLAHSHPSILHWQVGWRCEEYDTSSLACNDINPASLVIVLANRIGLAHESLVVDQNPLAPVINNAVRSAEITVLQPPYTVSDVPDVAEQLEVRIDLEVASTLLSTDAANVRDAGNGVFKHVEDGNVRLSYQATLALDANAKIIGGRWTGRKLSGPDFVWGARGDSASDIAVHDHLDARPQIRYSVLEALHAKSVSIEPGIPQLDITQVIPNNQTEMFSYYTGDAKIRVHGGRYIRILGRLSGEFLHSAKHMNCTVGADDQERPEDMQVLNFEFTRLNRHGKFLDYDLVTEVKREGANRLKCNFYGPGPDQKLARLAYAHATVIYP
ncbi:MAG: hypothetical protein HY074_20965, partial [Deltaproteobacteria bacterium]|nr:hypothetical protein [Deltaproteobacteria bacterium]